MLGHAEGGGGVACHVESAVDDGSTLDDRLVACVRVGGVELLDLFNSETTGHQHGAGGFGLHVAA